MIIEKSHRVNGHQFKINSSKGENLAKSKIKNRVVEAFQGLPGPNSRLFMGCQAAELNHFAKPLKMGLQLTNHRFNFDKFRVSMRVTVKRSEGHARITWIGVAYLMKAG